MLNYEDIEEENISNYSKKILLVTYPNNLKNSITNYDPSRNSLV